MSTEKSEQELNKEAGVLIAKMQKNLNKLSKSLGENYKINQTTVAALREQLEQFERWQKDPKLNASMYTEALEKLYKTIHQAMRHPDFRESQSFSARLSRSATTLLQRQQKVVNEQVSKQESEAKEVEAEQVAQGDDSDDDVIILPREKDDSVEQQEEESDEDVVFLQPERDQMEEETKIQEHDVEAEQIESEIEIETDAEMQEKLAAIEGTKAKVEAVIKSKNAPQQVESKEHNNESEQKEVEDVEVLRERLKAVQAGQSRNEALMSGIENIDEFTEMTKKTEEIQALKSQPGTTEPEVEQIEVESEGVTKATDVREEVKNDKGKEEIGSGQTVEPQTTNEELAAMRKNISGLEKRSQSPEFADFKDFATNALREMGNEGYANDYLNRIENALVSGNVQDNENRYTQARTLLNEAAATKNDIDRGGKLRGFTEALKTIAQEIQSPSQTVTKSNVTQSFVSIINKADNIVTSGARVQDQIAELRRDINVIKSQPDFKQYQIERAEEKSERLENALVEAGISSKKTQGPVNKSSEKKLDPDQKAAYQAISKLDTLLERVEKSKVGIVKSILKGQVRKHLEAMNANPLKDSIQKVGGLKTEKTQEAKTTPKRQ